jgi:biopolymer transport protein ExbD
MGVGNIGGGKGGKRSLDAEINLVPFIDLLSMCICFLLMTAVWTQLASLQVKQANGTEGAAAGAKSLDLDVKFVSNSKVQLSVKGFKPVEVEAASEDELLKALDSQVASLKEAVKGSGEIQAVMLTPKTGVDYGTLVSVMDVLRKNQLVNLGVVPVAPTGKGG